MTGETVIFHEMLEAGVDALAESRKRKFGDLDTVVAVYLAMEAMREVEQLRREGRSVH